MISSNCFESRAIRDHRPIHQSQLPFKKGDTIWVYETAPTGWWRGEFNGRRGLFPQSYVQRTNNGVLVADDESTSTTPPTLTIVDENKKSVPPPPVAPRSTLSTASDSAFKVPSLDVNGSTTTSSWSPSSTTPSTSNSLSAGSTPNHLKLSPRFNVNREMLENVALRSNTPSPVHIDDPDGEHRRHGRKNSGPSTYISQYDGENPLNLSSGNIGAAGKPNGNGNLSTIDEAGDSNQMSNSTSQSSKYKTLPHNPVKVRKPLSSLTEQPSNQSNQPNHQPQQRVSTPRITVDKVNTEIPYYITRCLTPHAKQSYDELALNTGDLIIVYNSSSIVSEWWVGKLGSTFGVFPKQCVEIIKDLTPQSRNNTTSPVNLPSPNSNNNNKNLNNNLNGNNSTSSSPTTPSTPTSSLTMTAEEEGIAKKIEASLSHLESREELLDAIKTLAVKFITRTNDLRKELDQEKTLRMAFEKELYLLKSKK